MRFIVKRAAMLLFAAVVALGGMPGLNGIGGGGQAYASTSPDNREWMPFGEAGFTPGQASYYSMAADEEYGVYVSFQNGASGPASVMKNNGGGWELVGEGEGEGGNRETGFSPGMVQFTSIAIDDDGNPVVAFQDEVLAGAKATVMKYSGNAWGYVGNRGVTSEMVGYTSMAIHDGVIYMGNRGNSSTKAQVKKFDGNGWSDVGPPGGFSNGDVKDLSLAINDNGTPYLAFKDDGSTGRVKLMYFDGTWKVVGNAPISSGSASSPSLAFDGQGDPNVADVPYVAYRDEANGNQVTVARFVAGDWETVGGPVGSTTPWGSVSLAIDDGAPYVAYIGMGASEEEFTVLVRKYNGSNWDPVGDEISGAHAALPVILKFYDGVPYVAYTDTAKNYKMTVMKFDVPPTPPTIADANRNSVSAAPTTVLEGETITLTAVGDRQSEEAGVVIGDERYIPVDWASAELGQSGRFVWNGTGYAANYVPQAAGSYTVDAGFQKQIWDGDSWEDAVGQTDIKTTGVTVNAPTYTTAPIANQTLATLPLGYAPGSQEVKTIEIANTGTGRLTNLATALSGADASRFVMTQPLTATLNSGAPGTSFTVQAKDGLPVGTYTATVTLSADLIADVTFTVTQVVNVSLKGDVNGDGFVTPADALYITKYVQGKMELTEGQKQTLDMNDDTVVDNLDAAIILQIYLGGGQPG